VSILPPRALAPLLLGLVVLLLDCASLEKVSPDTCGNGVIEANEECDSFPNDPSDTTHARCGAPTEGDKACHLRCGVQPAGNTLTCPDGWGCNTKGICRQPTGEFLKALGAVSGGAMQLAAGDFDGDGRRDLVGSGPRTERNASRVRVHYFDDAGALVNVASLPAAAVAPAVFDHDHKGGDDIAFGIGGGLSNPGALGVVTGLADRSFLSVLFPAASVPDVEALPVFVYQRSADVGLPDSLGSQSATLLVEPDASQGLVVRSLERELGAAASSGFERTLPGVLAAEVRGLAASAPIFDGNPLSTCDEVVIAAQTSAGGRVYVLSPCTYVPGLSGKKRPVWNTGAEGLKTFVVKNLRADSVGVLITDVTGDGHLDILVDTDGGPSLIYSSADGTTLSGPEKWAPKGVLPNTMPIAAGDLNADGRSDYVFPNAVVASVPEAGDGGVSTDRSGTFVTDEGTGRRIAAAAIGHFNGDLYPDVVTSSAGAPDLQFFATGAQGSVTVTIVTTNGIVQGITKGDFDGDHIDDIAIVEATSDAQKSDVSIAYGRPFGTLEAPRRVGTVDVPRGMTAVPHGPGGVADLGLFSFYEAKKGAPKRSTSFTILSGSGERQPLAPLFFVDTLSCSRTVDPCGTPRTAVGADSARLWSPLGLAAGRLVNPEESSVLAYALGSLLPRTANNQFSLGAWVADADGNAPGGLAAPRERQLLDGQFDIYDTAADLAKIATVTRDIDNAVGGLAEIVVTTNLPNGKDAGLLVVHPSVSGPPAFKELAGLRVSAGAQLDAVDLDGDGFRDAIASFGSAADEQIVVFLNDGAGNFIVPGVRLTLEAAHGTPVAFAAIAMRGAPVTGGRAQTHSLAVLTDKSVVIATLDPDKRGFEVKDLATLIGGRGVKGATGIAAADFNGDGVEDIAIADGTIRLILQSPDPSKK
jgi:hypothetical protein